MEGMTMSVSRVEETIPPIIGTAMRYMTSEPVPVLQRTRSPDVELLSENDRQQSIVGPI
jgi:hypothetical protein